MSYKRLSSDPSHALNAVCPYFTMFPLEYPLNILKRYAGARRVLDPFCGRGTTLYAARVVGTEAWGVDTSPVAVAIAKAKLAQTSISQSLSLARRILSSGYDAEVPQGSFWKRAFHESTLRDLCCLRQGLMKRRSDAAALLRAIALGCLHGPLTKDLHNPSYFSNQMPRTFAPKPDYAVRFWRSRTLRPPRASIMRVLEKKAERITIGDVPSQRRVGGVITGNAEHSNTFSELPRGFDLVITSPPYLGMVNYVQDQWLRNWFLGGPSTVDYERTEQLSHRGPEDFTASLARVWDNVGRLRSRRMDMFIRFGAIPSREVAPLDVLRESLRLSRHPWMVKSARSARTSEAGKRQADHMSIDSSAVREYDVHAVSG
jgi:hypothetical protein